jgi:DNA-binding NarL/FixJ family response regulator
MTATQRPNAAVTPVAATNGEPAMIRILIADDHAIVRAGLKQFIAREGDIQVAGEASSGAETIELVRNGEFDIVLLDIRMPDGSGIDTLRKLKTLRPDLPVLMLSGFAEEQYALNLLRAGAAGYVTKEAAPAELVKAIRTVMVGRKYVSPELAQILAAGVSGDSDKPLHAQLSQREFQIFCKLAAGESVSKIADELLISVKTVSTYRTRILQKMNLNSNADITYYAIKNGLIQ